MYVYVCYLLKIYGKTPKQLMLSLHWARRVLKAAPANALDDTHWPTQVPRGKLHQKPQPRLLTPSKGFGCFPAEVCAATVLAIPAVLQVR